MQLNICPPLCLSFHLSIGLAQCCANYPSSVDCWKSHFSSCRKHRIEWLNGSKIQFSGSVKIFILAFCSFVLSFIHLEKAKYRQAKREWNLCLWGGVAVSWQLFVSHSTVLSLTQYPCVVVVVFFFLICFVLVDQECSQVCPPGLSLRREVFFRAIQLHQLFHMWGSHFPSSLFNAEGQKLEFCSGSFPISNKLKCL